MQQNIIFSCACDHQCQLLLGDLYIKRPLTEKANDKAFPPYGSRSHRGREVNIFYKE